MVASKNAALQQLQLALSAAEADRKNFYLLYDPRLNDRLGLLEKPLENRPHARIRVPEHVDNNTQPKPLLLVLNGSFSRDSDTPTILDDPLLIDSVFAAESEIADDATSMEAGRSICSWIVSDQAFKPLAERLSKAACLTDPEGRPRWIRWHDPRVLSFMWPSLTVEQRQALFGPGTNCLLIDALGRFQSLATQPEPLNNPRSLKRSLNREQWQRLFQSQAVTALIRGWNAFRTRLPEQASERVYDELKRALSLGLQGSDVTTFVMYAVQLRHGFETDPLIKNAIAQAHEAEGAVEQAFANMPESVWDKWADPAIDVVL